ncbi:hypothetical protein JZ751_024576 [Albula glossodonta]|uniref:Uncharacterized protein n=1 Tax=Albula glossodonta TaxID=121402 RepID=A0A8T2PM97_9TELE|nr:hypothetical protein JZ751_024576 [Albula glossodonta]
MLSKTGAHKEELKSAASSLRGSHSAALSRLALIEDRFRNRFQAREDRDTDPPPPESTPPSAQSSGELSMKGSRFLKKRSTPVTQQQSPEPNKSYRPTAAQLRSSVIHEKQSETHSSSFSLCWAKDTFRNNISITFPTQSGVTQTQ